MNGDQTRHASGVCVTDNVAYLSSCGRCTAMERYSDQTRHASGECVTDNVAYVVMVCLFVVVRVVRTHRHEEQATFAMFTPVQPFVSC